MSVSIADLAVDLDAESTVLSAELGALTEVAWETPTPADGWTIKDQIAHLSFFDAKVTTAVTDPERFRNELAESMKNPASFGEAIATANRTRSGRETVEWFTATRAAMVRAFVEADLSMRVPWYGPEMSVASALTARIMETWAHGQDVFDALGRRHPMTSALRQVAHIGVRALPNSFITRGRAVPTDPVRVELIAPDGSEWIWGAAEAADRVVGPAEEFCLVVTQRRHRADTNLVVVGDIANEWIDIAQAFAGPAGTGRRAGQFTAS